MKIKRKPIVFHNLLTMTRTCQPDEWYEIALALRDVVITRGLYINAPILYRYEKVDDKQNNYTVYVPINAEVTVAPDMPFGFVKELHIADAFVFRLADLDYPNEKEALLLLQACAEQHNCALEYPFYNICLNVFDEIMLDIVAPIASQAAHAENGSGDGNA